MSLAGPTTAILIGNGAALGAAFLALRASRGNPPAGPWKASVENS